MTDLDGGRSKAYNTATMDRRVDDPWEVLGVAPGASPAEVTRRHRVLTQIFHPDRFATMPPDVRAEAELRMKAVNAAYDAVRRGTAPRPVPRPPQRPAPEADGRRRAAEHARARAEREARERAEREAWERVERVRERVERDVRAAADAEVRARYDREARERAAREQREQEARAAWERRQLRLRWAQLAALLVLAALAARGTAVAGVIPGLGN